MHTKKLPSLYEFCRRGRHSHIGTKAIILIFRYFKWNLLLPVKKYYFRCGCNADTNHPIRHTNICVPFNGRGPVITYLEIFRSICSSGVSFGKILWHWALSAPNSLYRSDSAYFLRQSIYIIVSKIRVNVNIFVGYSMCQKNLHMDFVLLAIPFRINLSEKAGGLFGFGFI